MHEARCLADHRIGLADKGRQAEFRYNPLLAIEKIAPRCRAEEGIVCRQGCANLLEKIGSLQKLDAMVAIDQPLGMCALGARDLLEAQNIRFGIDDISHQRLMQPAAPNI